MRVLLLTKKRLKKESGRKKDNTYRARAAEVEREGEVLGFDSLSAFAGNSHRSPFLFLFSVLWYFRLD